MIEVKKMIVLQILHLFKIFRMAHWNEIFFVCKNHKFVVKKLSEKKTF